jgi:hypothetical protein
VKAERREWRVAQKISLIINHHHDQNPKGLISHIYIKKGLAFQENTEESKSKGSRADPKSPFVKKKKIVLSHRKKSTHVFLIVVVVIIVSFSFRMPVLVLVSSSLQQHRRDQGKK